METTDDKIISSIMDMLEKDDDLQSAQAFKVGRKETSGNEVNRGRSPPKIHDKIMKYAGNVKSKQRHGIEKGEHITKWESRKNENQRPKLDESHIDQELDNIYKKDRIEKVMSYDDSEDNLMEKNEEFFKTHNK